MSLPTIAPAVGGRCLVLVCGLLGTLAAARAAGPVDAALAVPPASRIPAAQLRPAVEQAVANGVASLMARILADGNDFGLAFPPRVTRSRVGMKKVPARREMVTVDVFEHDYAEVDQLVPEVSAGVPTGRFVRDKVKVRTKSRKVGTKQVERLIRDPEGTYSIEVPEYGPGGPDVYELNLPGFNGMALWVLASAGQAQHPATDRLASGLSELIDKFGISDHTFDVAWMAAGFTALGADSPHAGLAQDLVAKLVDGQVREKGGGRGLWGPVCINYGYFSKLFEMQDALRQEVEVKLPQAIEAAPPQQRAALANRGKEVMRVLRDVQKAYKNAASLGTRLMDVTEPYRGVEQSIIPGLPLYIYNRVVVDVESTAVAAFALAEARRAGMLPAETQRAQFRGKKLHPGEKTEAALKLAGEQMAASIAADGGCPSLVRQGVNTGFDKSSLKIGGVPFTGTHPGLFEIETAVTDVSGQAALEFLAAAAPGPLAAAEQPRERARARAAAIAERWYAASASGYAAKAWPSVYDRYHISHADLAKSADLPQPPLEPQAVDALPWGRGAAFFEIVPQFAGLFAADRGAALLENDLFRQIAYRLVSLQDGDGQWKGPRANPLSSGCDALAMQGMAARFHTVLTNGKQLKAADPVTFQFLLRPAWAPDYDFLPDNGSYATLTSLALLVRAVDGPVDLTGVTVVPEATEQTGGEPLSPAKAAALAKRPNAARSDLYAAVLGGQRVGAAAAPAAAAAEPATVPAEEKAGEEIGTLDELLSPTP
jgi:hypothetical protein